MKSVYLKEQKRYSIRELRNVLGCAENDLVHLIRKLKEYGLIKVVRKTEYQEGLSELADEDIELADVDYDDNGYYYVLTYVGIAVVAGVVLKCFPKYISSTVNPHSELKQILKVLAKINSSEQVIKLYNDNSENVSINILAVMIAILNDYYTYGTYSNTEDVIESNGNGEILWDRTINETFTILSDNRPYYVDLQTKHRKNDDYDFFKRLHECVITEICRELNDAGLLD